MNLAVSELYRLLTNKHKLDAFIAVGKRMGFNHRESLLFVSLYADLPRLAQELSYSTEERLSGLLTGRIYCSSDYAREHLAAVQSGLIRILRRPETHAQVLQHCPELGELLSIPAFGWQAYDKLLNHPHPWGFWTDIEQDCSSAYGRSVSRFQTYVDRVDAIYVTDAGMRGHYVERLPLEMPEEAPTTFGEELRAVDRLCCQALRLFEACRMRGRDFHRNAPDQMIVRFHGHYEAAVRLTGVELVCR